MMKSSFICEKCGSASYEQFSQTQVRCMQCGTVNIHDTGYKVVPEFQLSSDASLLDFEKKINYITASLGKRLLNYVIDIFFIMAIFSIILFISDTFDLFNMVDDNVLGTIVLIVMPIYYVVMEYKFGKTIGKFVTKTKVISTNGNNLSLLQCIGRILCRIIPFEWVSGLISSGVFWHDSIPQTLVVEDN